MPTSEHPRRRRRRLREYTALASAATLTAMTATLAGASPPAQAALNRPRVATPDATSSYTTLTGVSAESAADAWAAGYYDNSSGAEEPLILHWNGTAWTKVTSPAPSGAKATVLTGVSANSAADAWAAGYYDNSSGVYGPLILHWNGTAWTKVTSPAPSGATAAFLLGVSADSSANAWAAGDYLNSSGAHEPLTEHWNGTAWKTVKTPAPSGGSEIFLTGVSADSSADAWAVGSYTNSSGANAALTLHWNGTAWKVVKTPAPSGATTTSLSEVSADSATDAWAVGYYDNSSEAEVPLILHWNGTAWSRVTSPAPSGAKSIGLSGVSADSATDAWAVGAYTNSSNSVVPLTLHWNGTAWKVVKSPVPSGAQAGGINLNAVSVDSSADAWAAGYYTNSSYENVTLTQHWNGTAWKTVKSPNGS